MKQEPHHLRHRRARRSRVAARRRLSAGRSPGSRRSRSRQANGSRSGRRQGRRLACSQASCSNGKKDSTATVTQPTRATSSRGRRRPATTPNGDVLLQPRPEPGQRAVLLPRPARRLPEARGPVRPGPDDGQGPRRRRDDLRPPASTRTSRRPTPRSRRTAIAAVRKLPLARVQQLDQGQHRRPLARLPRRARRQRHQLNLALDR